MTRYRIEMEVETEAFIPNADMSDIPDLNQHFEAIVGDVGEIKSFHIRKLYSREELTQLSYDAGYLHGNA